MEMEETTMLEYGDTGMDSVWEPVYNIIKTISSLTAPILDFLSPTCLLFPLIPFTVQDISDYENVICDGCGQFSCEYGLVSLETYVKNRKEDEYLEKKIIEMERKLKTINLAMIMSIREKNNLVSKIDYLHDRIMAITDSPNKLVPLKIMADNIVKKQAIMTNTINNQTTSLDETLNAPSVDPNNVIECAVPTINSVEAITDIKESTGSEARISTSSSKSVTKKLCC